MKQTMWLRLGALALALAFFASSAHGYYHFVHYASQTPPFTPIYEKFNLASLDHSTLYFYVTPEGPTNLYTADSFTAVLSQLRLAGLVWDGVATSQLRLAYGGLVAADLPQTRPHMEVSFAEVPPGLYAMGAPTVRAEVTGGPDGPYMPILKSVLIISQDLSQRPSYGSPFFLTAVHEMGHALGLQHTLTSSVMSVEVTRASTKSLPLGVDDVAAISLLYPAPSFKSSLGSISGRVTMGDAGVALASVVAISPYSQAVSTLTNPDGTYRIEGLPARHYLVYVHALPPGVQSGLGPADIVLPQDAQGQPIPAGAPFATAFWPGTPDWRQADPVAVTAGAEAPDVNFTVAPQAQPSIFDVSTYSFPDGLTVKPAYLDLTQSLRQTVVAGGEGLVTATGVRDGLKVGLLGAGTVGDVVPYAKAPSFLDVTLSFSSFTSSGTRHLVFSAGDETYVLPSAVTLVHGRPPSIDSITPGRDQENNPILTLAGTNLNSGTRILMDGIVVPILSRDAETGNMVVEPPPAPINYQSRVVALNADGQSSSFSQQLPALYTYDFGPPANGAVTLSPASIPPGVETMVEFQGTDLTFPDGQTWIGLGSSDVTVRNLWRVSPTLVRANVAVAPWAQVSDTLVSVAAGFEQAAMPGGFHIGGPASPSLSSDVRNAAGGRDTIYPGATAIVPVSNLPANAGMGSVTLVLNDRTLPVLAVEAGQITFQLPADAPVGPGILRLTISDTTVPPVIITLDLAPPVVTGFINGDVAAAAGQAKPGDLLTVIAANLGAAGSETAMDRISATIGGVTAAVASSAQPVDGHPELHAFLVQVPPALEGGQTAPLVITLDGRASDAFPVVLVAVQ